LLIFDASPRQVFAINHQKSTIDSTMPALLEA
jgi:hypothetical protein